MCRRCMRMRGDGWSWRGWAQGGGGVRGDLYPCTPMVGEDRDCSRGAELRIGHVDMPAGEVVQRVFAEGLHCSRQGDCACAGYLETGDTGQRGAVGSAWQRMCLEVGVAVGRALADVDD